MVWLRKWKKIVFYLIGGECTFTDGFAWPISWDLLALDMVPFELKNKYLDIYYWMVLNIKRFLFDIFGYG